MSLESQRSGGRRKGRKILAAALCAALLFLTACGPAGPEETVLPSPGEGSPSPSQGGASPAPPEGSTPSASAPPEGQVPAVEPFALTWDPEGGLSPVEMNAVNQTLAPLVFEGLFALDEAFEPQPVLCTSYTTTENGLSWTFRLRGGVCFSDGTPLTGRIAARSLEAARNSGLYRSRLSAVAAVIAGEDSVTLELNVPSGNLPALLDVPIFLTPEEGSPIPLGTGPYRFEEAGEGLCLRAVDSWWQGSSRSLPVTEILLRQATTVGDRIAAFDTGLATLADTDFTATNALGYSTSYDTWDYPTTAMLYVGFNFDKGPCQEAAVRRAAARCLDREELCRTLLAGHADPACLPVHPQSSLYSEVLGQPLSYDPERAAQSLAEGGWLPDEEGKLVKEREKLELTLLVNSENPTRTALAEALAEELEQLGATVTVRKLTWAVFLNTLKKGDFDLYVGQVKLTADFDPTALLTGELNYGKLENETLLNRLEIFRASTGTARKNLADAVYAWVASEAGVAPICFTRASVLTQWGRLSGLSPVQGNVFYGMENWAGL